MFKALKPTPYSGASAPPTRFFRCLKRQQGRLFRTSSELSSEPLACVPGASKAHFFR
jgi:hypothetical protein